VKADAVGEKRRVALDEGCPLQGPTLPEAICVARAPGGDMTFLQ